MQLHQFSTLNGPGEVGCYEVQNIQVHGEGKTMKT